MARLYTSGAELNSAASGVECEAVSASNVSISSTTVRSGSYAWRFNATAGTGFCTTSMYTSNQNNIGYFRMYMNVASIPSTTNTIVRILTVSGSVVSRLRFLSSGKVQLENSDGSTIIGTSRVLATGRWYCIEIKHDATTNPGALELRIDGATIGSGANNIQGSWGEVRWGGVATNSTYDFFLDDIAINDNSGSFQNSYPGSGKCILLHPNAAGDTTQWTIGGSVPAATNWQSVNENPPDDAVTFVSDLVLNNVDMYNVTNSGLAAGDTINVVQVGARFNNSNSADATSAFKLQIEKTASGTITQSAAITPNSTSWRTNVAGGAQSNYPLTLYQDPDASNWTPTTINSMQIGMTGSLIGVRAIQITNIWAYVDYTPFVSGQSRFFFGS